MSKSRARPHYLVIIMALAAMYYITGRLGLLLSVPPGYATAMWPPSGLAFAAILVLGYRYWPGVMLGSFGVNLFTSFDPTNASTMLLSGGIAMVIAHGAALQAIISAWLCRRWIAFPNALERTRDIGLLLLLAGPLGCLVNSLIGTITLASFGLIPLEKLPFNWLTWWVGDTIGVLIFGPIALLLANTTSDVTRRRKLAVTAALMSAFAVTVIVFMGAKHWEQKRDQVEFEKKSAMIAERIEHSIDNYGATIYSLSLFYRASQSVEEDEFRIFAQGILERFPGIKSLSWAPRVLDSERSAFETANRTKEDPNFSILEKGADGKLVPAQKRDEYYPVLYTAPFISQLKGFDNNSEEIRKTTMEQARDVGKRQVTPRLTLLQMEHDSYGILMFRPIYENGKPSLMVDEKRQNLKGYVAGAFSLPELISAIVPNKDPDIDFYITDNGVAPEMQLLYDSRTPDHKEAVKPLVLSPDALNWQGEITIPGRIWTVHCVQNTAAILDHQNWEVWLVLAGGLIFTGIFGVFVMVITARADFVQRLVYSRTRQLIENEKQLSDIVTIQRDVAHLHHDLQSAMNLIVERTQVITGAESSVIEMLEGDEMVYRAASGSAASYVGLRLAANTSLSGQCVRENIVLRCNDAETDERVDKEACRKIGVVSMLVVPLTRGQKAVGVLKVLSSKHHAFTDKHIATLQLMAGVLSAALSDAIANDSLQQSEETFRSAMEHASIGMALVDLKGRWLRVNNALCELVGYTKAELMRMDFQSITHPEDLQTDLQYVRQMLDGAIQTYKLEKRYLHKDGRVIWVLLSVSLVHHADGSPRYFISQIQDITEQKEIDRIKGEFISVVSHELRTPLTSIRGSLGLILGALSTDLPEKVKGLIDIAHSNCERLILLINDILDIDKIAAGKMRFDLTEEALSVITQQAVLANQAYAQKFNARFEMKPIDDTIKIHVDAARYIQVLSNLLSNAAKFSPPDSVIEISTILSDSSVRILVKDSGSGIPEEFRSRIFGKFSQADSSATRAKGGTGLGLHITKQIVERMNGTIGFESEVGLGTTFFVDFPLAHMLGRDDLEEKEVVLVEQENRFDLPYILHVEDDVDLSNMLATALYGQAEILTATTLRHARQLLQRRPFALMILDIAMPDGSGLSLLGHIKSLPHRAPHVIILAADAPAEEFQTQVDAVMVKSRISETKIVETILDILSKHKEARA